MIRILFVCLGNICRSPMAEAVMRQKIKNAGLEKELSVESAATSRWEAGHPPHRGTQEILTLCRIPFEGIVSTPLTEQDFYTYDYIIGMDHHNVADIEKQAPADWQGQAYLFMSLVEEYQDDSVPDPYYTGDFDLTYKMVDLGTDAWLTFLKNTEK